MDFEEALNCAIQKQKFLIRRKIDDTFDEETTVVYHRNQVPFFSGIPHFFPAAEFLFSAKFF